MTKCDMATQTLDPVHTEVEDVYKVGDISEDYFRDTFLDTFNAGKTR